MNAHADEEDKVDDDLDIEEENPHHYLFGADPGPSPVVEAPPVVPVIPPKVIKEPEVVVTKVDVPKVVPAPKPKAVEPEPKPIVTVRPGVYDERFKTTVDYHQVLTTLVKLKDQREQALVDLKRLESEKKKAMEDPQKFAATLLAKGEVLPRRQLPPPVPKVDFATYSKLPAKSGYVDITGPSGGDSRKSGSIASQAHPFTSSSNEKGISTSHAARGASKSPSSKSSHMMDIDEYQQHHQQRRASFSGDESSVEEHSPRSPKNSRNSQHQSSSPGIPPFHAPITSRSSANAPRSGNNGSFEKAAEHNSLPPSSGSGDLSQSTARSNQTAGGNLSSSERQTQTSSGSGMRGSQPSGNAIPQTSSSGAKRRRRKPSSTIPHTPWTLEEQKRLEQLLYEYPDEPVAQYRWEKIARALNRTPKQVMSRIHRYFERLARAGLPVPGRLPEPSGSGTSRSKPSKSSSASSGGATQQGPSHHLPPTTPIPSSSSSTQVKPLNQASAVGGGGISSMGPPQGVVGSHHHQGTSSFPSPLLPPSSKSSSKAHSAASHWMIEAPSIKMDSVIPHISDDSLLSESEKRTFSGLESSHEYQELIRLKKLKALQNYSHEQYIAVNPASSSIPSTPTNATETRPNNMGNVNTGASGGVPSSGGPASSSNFVDSDYAISDDLAYLDPNFMTT